MLGHLDVLGTVPCYNVHQEITWTSVDFASVLCDLPYGDIIWNAHENNH